METLNLFGALSGIGVLCAGLGFAYSQFKAGASKAKDELVDTLKETALAERAKSNQLTEEKSTLIKSHQEQINELNLKLGVLQGKAEANEKKMHEYLEILQNRDPDYQNYMKQTTETLVEIRNFMRKLNEGVQAGTDFNNGVLETTAHGGGEPVRVKV